MSNDALIFVNRMYPINYTHSKLWPLQWTETTWSFRKMGNATSVTLIILWMFLQNIRLCTISSALTKKNKSSYERALKPFFLFYCLLSHSLFLSLSHSHFAFSEEIWNRTSIAFLKSKFCNICACLLQVHPLWDGFSESLEVFLKKLWKDEIFHLTSLLYKSFLNVSEQ